MSITPTDTAAAGGVQLARQPILDDKGKVFGYELLYRANVSQDESSPDAGGDPASARILADAVDALGLDNLTGGRPIFMNFTRTLLLGDAWTLLPPSSLAVTLGPDVPAESDVVDRCRLLRERGYALCLDRFTPGANAEALLPYATLVKVDAVATPAAGSAAIAKTLKPRGVDVIATNVNTAEIAAAAKAAGHHLFQGRYFCSAPRTFGATALPARRLAYLNLLTALNKDNLSVSELEELVKHDLSLSYRVLKLVNSAAFGLRNEVTSIRHALVLLGREQIRKWASVWTMAGLNGSGTEETVAVALLRARSCELLGTALAGSEEGAGYFLLGLCSLLDVIVGRPMKQALSDMPLPAPIKAALLGEQNEPRTALDAVIAYEEGQWDEASAAMERLSVPVALSDVYADALRWARQLSRAAEAA